MGKFIDAVIQSPVSIIDLSEVDFDNIGTCDKFNEIIGLYSNDRLCKFVMSTESPMFVIANNSSEWDNIENAVEVYKLPANLKWPTMFCVKQRRGDYLFPELIIRRRINFIDTVSMLLWNAFGTGPIIQMRRPAK